MKSLRIFLMLAMFMALAISTICETQLDEEELGFEDDGNDLPLSESEQPTSLRGTSRFLAQKTRVVMTCNKYPRVCRASGSPGPDCCKKKCVNVLTDRLNCGMCGKKCKYSEICCKGECVNPSSNKKHCGGCNNKCGTGNSCAYGICSYA
ncbi:hypothetical protein L1049_022945 [Liquidambar formosana]|uniref:Stigma-specific STIG1-like protein 1 n=1 Tax=Liquidambar formosana TaxID=63359 RepID=A0AAP0WRX3_LIQFO